MYEHFHVHKIGGGNVGRVDAQNAAEAVYRLVGGEYGRKDFHATPACSKCGSVLSAVTWTCVRGQHCK